VRNPDVLRRFDFTSSLKRRTRDVVGSGAYGDGSLDGLSILQVIRFWISELNGVLNISTTKYKALFSGAPVSETPTVRRQDESLRAWEERFHNFIKNVNFFCQHTGCEVDELAPPRETINNLRKFASDRRQGLAPLLEVNASLNKELASYKHINAALQTRHTIEKLVFELPDTREYDDTGSGPKWRTLWGRIWADAGQDANNPFHNLWTQSTGEYARNNIRDKGRDLFADMSGEIHGYDRGRRDAFDYEHFDASARRVAQTLHATLNVSDRTGDANWADEIRKYPVNWPNADNMALTLLERLKGRVANLQERLHRAEEEWDQENTRQAARQAEIQTAIDSADPLRQQREGDRAANDNLQDDLAGLDGLFE
jgi:hypothetical protein